MTNKTFIAYYSWFVKILIFAIPFLSLIVASSMFFPYITGKNFGFRILVELAFVLWLGLAILSKEHRPKASMLFWAVMVFIGIVGLADLFGVNPYHSFWSNYERMEGFIGLLHLGAYFLILTSVFKTKKDWLIFFNLFVLAGVIVGFYGLLQKLGYKESIIGGFRIDGTIGNPTYLAAYLLLVSFLAIFLILSVKINWLKYLYAVILAFLLLIIYFTATRGAILALVVGILLAAFLYLIFAKVEKPKDKLYKKIIVVILILAIAAPLGLWLLRNADFVKKSEVLSRLTSISWTEKTIKARFMIWEMASRGFKERPILGWGQENFIRVFSKYYNPKMYDQEPWFDRAHNIVFDWLINAGILGFLSFIFIFASAAYLLWSAFRKKLISAKEGIVFITALVVYFVQNIFVFDNINTYMIFFALLAYINSFSKERVPADANQRVVKSIDAISSRARFQMKQDYADPRFIAYLVVGLGVALFALGTYFINIKPIWQARAIIDALRSTMNARDASAVLDNFKKALAYNTFGRTENLEQFGRVAEALLKEQGFPQENKLEFVKATADEFEKYFEKEPDDIRNRLFIATLYNRASDLDSSFIEKSERHIREAFRLSPTKQTVFFASAENYLVKKDYNNALLMVAEAVQLAPEFVEPQINLATVAIFAGRQEVADKAMAEAEYISQGMLDPDNLERLGNAYIRVGKFDKAVLLYEKVISIMPDEAQYRAHLAAIYANLGRIDEAIIQAQKAAELNPEKFAKDTETFINQIKNLKK